MKLLTEELRRRLPALYSTETDRDPIAQAKFFTPWTSWTWYATEFDGEDSFFGLVHGLDCELGYFSLSELESIRGPAGLCIERDLYFKPTPLSQLRAPVQADDESLAPGFGRAPLVASRMHFDANATCPLGASITLETTTSSEAPMRTTNQSPRAQDVGLQTTTPPASERWTDELAPPAREPTKAERVRETADKAIEALAQALQEGRSEALTEYLGAMSRFHRYSFHNILLIACQRPDATHVAGFRTWQQEFGRYVMVGEKGIAILAPMVRKPRAETSEAGEGETETRVVRGFRVVYVFDVKQTDGKPLPEFATVAGDPGEHLDNLRALVSQRGIDLAYEPDLAGAHGYSTGGKIILLQGQTPAQEFSVLAHEVAHELLHKVEAQDRPDKTTRETEAEAVAYVVTTAVGLQTGTAARDYIQLYRGDKETLARSLERIQQTASLILEAVLPNE